MSMESLTEALIERGKETVGQAMRKLDGFVNFATGLGSSRDKQIQSIPYAEPLLPVAFLEAMFSSDDIAQRIVTSLPERALKQGFGVSLKSSDIAPRDVQEQAEELLAECDRLGVKDKIYQAWVWGRLYGFGALIIGAEGSGAPEEPMDDERVTAIKYLLVVDRRDLYPDTFYDDPEADNFGEVETYRIQPSGSYTTQTFTGVTVHASRIITFGGAMTARRDKMRNGGFDFSVLQRVFTVLQQAHNNWAASATS